ncbi:MAG: aconitase family protein [Lentisphaerae bacterium]|nr:aconitase family protein [Lentisphaerota bacterium]
MANGTVIQKILDSHYLSGEKNPGQPVSIKIDQTLTQDATGTMAYLELEAMGVDRVRTELSVSYVDHNMMQNGPENQNDHLYLQSVAAAKGVYFSRPGNGICHQVHLERFGVPGKTLLGSDSHTPTGGGIGMMAIGAGGLDVALAMAGKPFRMSYPKIIGVNLSGHLKPWLSAKDVILKMLSILTTKGNVGCMVEYFGSGVETLSVPERATITNMGAELGVTTSVFPSDERTKSFLEAQGRGASWVELKADADAEYDRVIEIDLKKLVPMAASPSSPDNIKTVAEIGEIPVQQVIIGSCTETSCGACIGQGMSPANDAVTLRTFNRNFPGRTGTKGDKSYLVSPAVAATAALTGKFTDPRLLGIKSPRVSEAKSFLVNDDMIIPPVSAEDASKIEIIRKPTIGKPPVNSPLPENINGEILLKVGDKITTDHIMPAGIHLKHRSNIPEYSKVVFECFNEPGKPTFAQHAAALRDAGKHGIIVARESYGQGSSREHAAICPMYLGVKAVVAVSIERIHAANLVNFGIVPLLFANSADYDQLSQGDSLKICEIRRQLEVGKPVKAELVKANGVKMEIELKHSLSAEDISIILPGGCLNC